MPAPKGNKHAQKPEDERLGAVLHVRCTPKEKNLWKRAAYPGKLADWVRDTLNREADSD